MTAAGAAAAAAAFLVCLLMFMWLCSSCVLKSNLDYGLQLA
jgi:hypothetical protein